MNEARAYGATVASLLIVSYLSWNRQEESGGSDQVTILDLKVEALESATFYAKTQTVSVSLEKADDGKAYAWFVVEERGKKRSFVGNDKVEKELLKSLAPFVALRSLGKGLGERELEEMELHKPTRKLVMKTKNGERVFEVGGRTSGPRDHYVRAQGGTGEVYLVASRVLGDLEFPDGKYMQRKVRDGELKDISKVTVSAGGRTKTVLHKNRLSPKDAFWASEAKPDENSESLGNYIDKLDKLTITDYSTDDGAPLDKGTPVLEVVWYGEDEDKPIDRMELSRTGDDRGAAGGTTVATSEGSASGSKEASYLASSQTTRNIRGKVSKFAAEQLERDLTSVLDD